MQTDDQLIQTVRESAFSQQCSPYNIIHLFEGGSGLHGACLPESPSDLDICGIFIEPRIHVFGLSPFGHFITSTGDDKTRNTKDDVDITLFSLRRWAMLACKGNPTALSFLFAENAKDGTPWAWAAEPLRKAIVAKSAAGHFSGFVTGQMKRLLGEKGQGKHGQRPELIAAHGYETKAAMHAVRLCGEGIELIQTGFITYPREDRDLLIEVRRGAWSLDKVCSVVSARLAVLEHMYQTSSLQAKPDYDTVNSLLVEMHEEFYN